MIFVGVVLRIIGWLMTPKYGDKEFFADVKKAQYLENLEEVSKLSRQDTKHINPERN